MHGLGCTGKSPGRPDRPSLMVKTLSVFGYLAMASGIVVLVLTRNLFSPHPAVIAVQVLAVVLMVWARVEFGRRSFYLAANPTSGGLVTTGPYRVIRHPIYTAACLFTWAGVAAHLSWQTALLAGVVLAGALVRIFCEEKAIIAEHPEYLAYSAQTWRMIPFVF